MRVLRASWARRSVVVAAIAAGVSPVVAVRVVERSVLENVRDIVVQLSGGAPLEVRLGFGEIAFPDAVVGLVAAHPGVSAAMPLVRGTVAMADDPEAPFELVGVDRSRGDIRVWSNDPRSIVLTPSLARRYHVDVGSSVALSTPRGIESFTLRALLEPDGLARAFGGRLAVMDLSAAQGLLLKTRRVDQVDLVLKPDADADQVRRDLETRLPQALTAGPPEDRVPLYAAAFAPFEAMLTSLALVCLAAGIYVAYCAGSTSATGGAVLVEGAILGTIGAALGVAGGIALARPCLAVVSEAMGAVLQLRLPFEQLWIDPWRPLEGGMLGIAGTVLASYCRTRFPTRSGSTVAVIALVMTVAVALASVLLSRRESFNGAYEEGGVLQSDLIVSAVTAEAGWLEAPLPERLGTEVRAIAGVRAVETVRVLPGELHRGRRISVVGLSDGLLDPSRSGPGWYVAGAPGRAAAALRTADGFDVGARLADRLGVRLGDSMSLDTPAGPMVFPIVGIVRDYTSDVGSVFMARRVLTTLWDEPTVNRLSVFVDDDASLEPVRLRIAELLRERYRLKVLTPREAIARQSRLFDRAFAFADVSRLLVVVVTFAGVLDLLLGAAAGSAIIRSASVGGLAAVLGAALGLLAAWAAVGRLHLGYHPALGTAASDVGLVVTTALVAGFAASRVARRRTD